MSLHDPEYFANKIITTSFIYQSGKEIDKHAYLADVLRIALEEMAAVYGPNKVSEFLQVGTPIFRAVVECCVGGFDCPIDNGQSIYDFVSALNNLVQERMENNPSDPFISYLPKHIHARLLALTAMMESVQASDG